MHLLSASDPPPFTLENERGKANCLVLCDHAGQAIPESLGTLGLPGDALNSHWVYDIGALAVSKMLARLLDAPLLYSNYSRIVIETMRRPDHPRSIVASGEGMAIPGNVDIGAEERSQRIRAIYEPYHTKTEECVENFLGRDIVPAIISIHSFTPVFFNHKRPWEYGVLWTQDPRLPVPVMEFLRAKGFTVGDNQPYDARMVSGATLNRHADSRRLPNILIEIRNDRISNENGARRTAELLFETLREPLSQPDLYSFYDGPLYQFDPGREKAYFDELDKKAQQGEALT
jgi:predicted N-formylglutamate amidohydrolase